MKPYYMDHAKMTDQIIPTNRDQLPPNRYEQWIPIHFLSRKKNPFVADHCKAHQSSVLWRYPSWWVYKAVQVFQARWTNATITISAWIGREGVAYRGQREQEITITWWVYFVRVRIVKQPHWRMVPKLKWIRNRRVRKGKKEKSYNW